MKRLNNDVTDLLKSWEFYTLKGNACYHQMEYKEACRHFAKSADILEPCLDKQRDCPPDVLRRFVLSCHNAAHSYHQLKHNKEAEYYYSHAHFRLLGLLH